MRTFEQRKAEIFCRAQKQKEKEKKARKRGIGIGVVTAFCLCITVGAVLHIPEPQSEDMIMDAESKGNAPAVDAPADGDIQNEEFASAENVGECPLPTVSVPEHMDEAADAESDRDYMDDVGASDEFYCSEEPSDEAVNTVSGSIEGVPDTKPEKEDNRLYQLLETDLALLHVNAVYEDDFHDQFGKVLLSVCDVLYMATDGEEKSRIKLVLPLSYAGQIEKGDVLVVLLSDDDVYDTLLRGDTVCILGKSQELFEELTVLEGFSAGMTEDEALDFFESFE